MAFKALRKLNCCCVSKTLVNSLTIGRALSFDNVESTDDDTQDPTEDDRQLRRNVDDLVKDSQQAINKLNEANHQLR